MTRKQLRRAAFHLRRQAKVLHKSNKLPPSFRWAPGTSEEQAEHEELLLLARELEALARNSSFVPFS